MQSPRTKTIFLSTAVTAWLVVFLMAGCSPDNEQHERSCTVATSPDHSWSEHDVEEFAEQYNPPIGDAEQRASHFFDALTAYGMREGDFDDYDPERAHRHYDEMLADIHQNRTFEQATAHALDEFARAQRDLELEFGDCY